ncbi:hypothetical protein QR98_0090990 [Sarcoptes scabiei]|uniref:Uncharacterized protein n=1 Tax=Sarcoptes scabiei TaxID=52283 RepID=A0A132AHR7_SARSC|nr:hypothetical protein QR98_0090990 [Sarcoptes scabiei]
MEIRNEIQKKKKKKKITPKFDKHNLSNEKRYDAVDDDDDDDDEDEDDENENLFSFRNAEKREAKKTTTLQIQ